MITIHMLCYNEEAILDFTLNHYKSKFPNMKLIVHDNYSTDNSINIIEAYGGEVKRFDTGNTISDQAYLDIKNHAWKDDTTDWSLIIDTDEIVDIDESQLISESLLGTSIIDFEGYNMVGDISGSSCSNVTLGAREVNYDKRYLFNNKLIEEINYDPGCHIANPTGDVRFSDISYKAYHYKWISLAYVATRYREFAIRLSEKNKENGWGFHYLKSEEDIIEEYLEIKKRSFKIL